MIITNILGQTNIKVDELQLTQIQLSYSTADIEKTIFFTPQYTPIPSREAIENATILIVHGDMFVLQEESFPQPSVPLTEQSGLFRIIGLVRESQP